MSADHFDVYNKPGCCAMCGEPVFEIETRWPEGSPLAGEPRTVGAPLDNAWRATLLLAFGRTTDITLCEKHKAPTPRGLSKVFHNLVKTYTRDLELRALFSRAPRTSDQLDAEARVAIEYYNDPPIGVLFCRRWSEIVDRDGAPTVMTV